MAGLKLGVNIDHVATLREARRTYMPDPLDAARISELAGCDSVVCHLREDRRHIKDADVIALRKQVKTRLNLEMSIARDIVEFALKHGPDQATLVPERRMEITTEGGLDVVSNEKRIAKVVSRLRAGGIDVSLFINPSKAQIDATAGVGAGIVEFHTGRYADAASPAIRHRELDVLKRAVAYAGSKGLVVNAGHGLNYENTRDVAGIKGINELNIGHAIISKAVFTGLDNAVKEMLEIMK